jgi:hypothetical protein
MSEQSERMKVASDALLCGVFDNTETMCRERYDAGNLTSSLPCGDGMRHNQHFPWGCFDDVPHNKS